MNYESEERSVKLLKSLINQTNSIKEAVNTIKMWYLTVYATEQMEATDKLFRNKSELIGLYQKILKDREIEVDGFKWPLNSLINATSNNDEIIKSKEIEINGVKWSLDDLITGTSNDYRVI